MANFRASADELPDLAAPLSLSWVMVGPGDPVLVGPALFASVLSSDGRSALVCISDDGRERWRVFGSVARVFVRESQVVTVLEEPTKRSLIRLDLESGAELSRQDCEFSMEAMLDDESAFIGTNVLQAKPAIIDLGRVDLTPEVRVKWRIRSRQGEDPGRFSFSVCVAAGRVVASRESGLEALDIETGEVLWARRSDSPGLHRWNPVATKNHVVVDTSRGTEVLELETGRVCWATTLCGPRRVGDGRLFMLVSGSRLLEFDLETGAVHRDSDLRANARREWSIDPLFVTDLAVSQTDIFVGDAEGRLWGFTRATGRATWTHKPTDTSGYGPTVPVIAGGGKLYISGGRWTATEDPCLYCYRTASIV